MRARARPGCGILPDYLLEAVVANGDAEQRQWAVRTLEVSVAARTARQAAAGPGGAADAGGPGGAADAADAADAGGAGSPSGPGGAGGPVPSTAARRIYDAGRSTRLPGRLVRTSDPGGDPGGADPAVDEAFDGLGATLELYATEFGRDSLDGAGLDLVASVHYGDKVDNAVWDGSQMWFGDGDGRLFNRFTVAVDVMGHELAHGVTQYSGELDYLDQSGALNESMSDVFGSMVKQHSAAVRPTAAEADWLIGAGLLAPGVKGVALRSMKAPGTAYDDPVLGRDPQPATMAGYVHTTRDEGGVHINSGIPNRAFHLAAVALGGYSWERAGPIWYRTLTAPGRPADLTFEQFAGRTATAAQELFGAPAEAAVRAAWQEVGVLG